MKNIKKLGLLVASVVMLIGISSCGDSSSEAVTTSQFVNTLVEKNNLSANDGKYIYTKNLDDKAIAYTFTLNCLADDSFGFIFEANLVRTFAKDGVTGTYTSNIKFLWGNFKSSIFRGLAHFENTAGKKDDVEYIFYGFEYDDENKTLVNSCYVDTIDGAIEEFRTAYTPANTTWSMTILQVSTLNSLVYDTVGCNLW